MTPAPSAAPANRRLVLRLLLLVAASFAFGFALVPLYDVLCQATGLNGRNRALEAGAPAVMTAVPAAVDRTRTLAVEFTGTVMPGLPWEIRPLTARLELHPGELQQVRYLVRNTSRQPIAGQAIPSISPGQAARHFQKLDCFCFRRQVLAAGEAREMALTFVVNPELDRDIRQITLSYAFYNIPPQEGR